MLSKSQLSKITEVLAVKCTLNIQLSNTNYTKCPHLVFCIIQFMLSVFRYIYDIYIYIHSIGILIVIHWHVNFYIFRVAKFEQLKLLGSLIYNNEYLINSFLTYKILIWKVANYRREINVVQKVKSETFPSEMWWSKSRK